MGNGDKEIDREIEGGEIVMYILILTFYAGAIAQGDSIALAVAEFSNKSRCELAGQQAANKFKTTVKPVKYICAEK